MRDKSFRRHNTEKYQKRQERLYNSHYRPWEKGAESKEWLNDVTPERRGGWKNHSYCETGGCECCCNPRHSSWCSKEEKQTVQERRSNEDLQDQLLDLSINSKV